MATDFNPGTGRAGILEQPSVRVFQQFGEVAPTVIRPLLEAVIIGEHFQIETKALAGLYDGTLTVYTYPDLVAGATIQTADVEVFLTTVEDEFDITSDPGVTIAAASVTLAAAIVPTKTLINHAQVTNIPSGAQFSDPNASFVDSGIRAGDTLTFETSAGSLVNLDSVISAANTVTYTILNVLDDQTLELNPALVSETGKFEYTVVRSGSSAGDVNISYRAKRTDKIGELIEVEDVEDLETQLGTIDPLNPVAFGMSLALQNTSNLVAGFVVEDQDSVTDHQAALSDLESQEVYALVPLTQNEAIFQIYEQHVNLMSDPHEKKERVVFINRIITDFETFQASSTTGGTDGADGSLFQDVNALFITNNVPVGSIIKLDTGLTGGDEGSFPVGTTDLQIIAVNSETEVDLIAAADTGLSGLTYTVRTKDFTKLQKARNCQDFAVAFNNRRVISLLPDTAEFPVGSTTQNLPGYFLGAMYAGLTSGTGPAQGFTNLSVSGATGLSNSNKFFSETQLGIIASGGNFIVIQENDQAPVSARHQLTTAVGTIETREYSIVKAVDYSSKFFRATLKPLIGIFNITEDFIDNQVRPTVNGIINDLVEEGIVGTGTHVTDIVQDKTQPDNLNVFIDFEVLFPANFINVVLVI